MGYKQLASFYDVYNKDIDYKNIAAFIGKALRENGISGKSIVLDLACGTGELTMLLSNMGYDMIGVDSSPEMLGFAFDKAASAGKNILFLNQEMTALDLYGTVDAAVCTLDGINHLLKTEDVKKTFEKVSLFLNPGGIFIFDVNSEYKFRDVFGNNTFVFEEDGVFCVWQNHYNKRTKICAFDFTFFEKQGELYKKHEDTCLEKCYTEKEITGALKSAGFELLGVYGGEYTFEKAAGKSERLVFVCKK